MSEWEITYGLLGLILGAVGTMLLLFLHVQYEVSRLPREWEDYKESQW